jgi:heme O synthase-like polyprenyltransferase
VLALRIWLLPSDRKAPKQLFGVSILYLFALFATLLGETLVTGG